MNIGLLDIRPIENEEWDKSIEFVWQTFHDCNEANMQEEGIESFGQFIHDPRLLGLFHSGYYKVYVLEKDGKIKGLIATKDYSHISLLFVAKNEQKSGIGSLMVEYIEILAINNGEEQVTVNAADGAEGFYKKNGYIKAGLSHVEDGVKSTPMVKFL